MAYGDDAGFQAWLTANGYTLPGTAPALAVLRNRGSTWLDATYEPLWTGVRTDPLVQENAWPRTGATINCALAIPSDVIPNAVVVASYRAAYLEGVTDGVLTGPIQSGPRTKREKVDVIEVEYIDDGAIIAGGAAGFVDPTIDGAMRQFICDDGDGKFFFAAIGS